MPLVPFLLMLACTADPPDDMVNGGAYPTFDTLPLAMEIADRAIERNPAEVQPHDWMQTVWAWSLLSLAERSGEERYRDYAHAWMDDWLPEVQAELDAGQSPFVSSDSTSPAIIAAALDDAAYAPIIDAADAYIASAPRTDEGAIEHWTEDVSFGVPDQVWIDSQFMLGAYMLERYRTTGDAAWADAFVEQYRLVSQLCRDDADQLYRHAYDDVTDSNIPADAVYWNRGNSWVLYAGVEGLILLGDDAPDWLAEAVDAHAWAVVDAMDGSGLWPTVLAPPGGDDPDNYLETSGSALLATALARGGAAGVLHPDLDQFVAPAVNGVVGMVRQDADGPVVTGTSFGTNPGDYDDYLSVSQLDDMLLGIGAVVLLLAHADGRDDTSVVFRQSPGRASASSTGAP